MSKVWAKIIVHEWMTLGAFDIWVATDLGTATICPLLGEDDFPYSDGTPCNEEYPSRLVARRTAIARARAWSRRLGGIPVEVEE